MVLSAVVLKALEVYAIPAPWLPLKTPRRLPSMGLMRTHRRPQALLGLPMGIAQTVVTTSNRYALVLAGVGMAEYRLVVGHESQLAQQQVQSYAAAQAKEAEAVADHLKRVHARWVCLPCRRRRGHGSV